MKYRTTIFKNRQAVQITPKPKRFIANGLKIYFKRGIDEQKAIDLPIATTDIQIGKIRYYLPKIHGFGIYKAKLNNK